ncbi:hypothetical protein EPO56_02680 [Patescibacteria group bacterium]|nr:MAG: hypothetical protein EPO56_02680 [Patescibacteria group bacterium]
MKHLYKISAVAIAFALFAGITSVALAEETNRTETRKPIIPRIFPATSPKEMRDANQKTDPAAGYTDPVRPGKPNDVRPDIQNRPGDGSGAFQNRASTTVGAGVREKMDNRLQNVKDRMGSTTGQNRAEDRVKMAMKHMAELVLVHIDRMEKMIVRIESRATKLDELGGNTAPARADLASARSELALARADLSTIQAGAVSIRNAPNMAAVSEALSPIKGAIKSAREHLKNARQFMGEAMKKLVEVKKTVRADDSETN